MSAYYNENDPNAAEWLRQLIKLGAIAPGDVDERSIVDVPSIELRSYTQHHFFAGIGAWSYALRCAGWPDDKPVVTGSCPCQPFSSAGKRKGADDERDLWWAMFWHIQQLQPQTIIGEQVASKDGLSWWDVVQSDLEGENYAATAFDLCAAGISAPHIRQRLFWVANANGSRQQWARSPQPKKWFGDSVSTRASKASTLAYPDCERRQQDSGGSPRDEEADGSPRRQPSKPKSNNKSCCDVKDCLCRGTDNDSVERMGNAKGSECEWTRGARQWRSGSANSGIWSDAIWITCQDGKQRPIKSGIFPLVDGIAPDLVRGGNPCIQTEATAEARTMRIKGYGNAIVAPLAIAFIQSVMEVEQ
ncbi:MAG: DNA cytosine methyltransferase [Cyanobacteria bacterium P01_E01_bin.6]